TIPGTERSGAAAALRQLGDPDHVRKLSRIAAARANASSRWQGPCGIPVGFVGAISGHQFGQAFWWLDPRTRSEAVRDFRLPCRSHSGPNLGACPQVEYIFPTAFG